MGDRSQIQGFNGVSYGAIITVTATDVSDGTVTGTFSTPYPLAFSVVITDGSGVNVELADAAMVFNSSENGDFSIGDGAATFALVAGQIIYLTAQPAREV